MWEHEDGVTSGGDDMLRYGINIAGSVETGGEAAIASGEAKATHGIPEEALFYD